MIVIKEKLFDNLIKEMGKCQKCLNMCSKKGKDYSLINIYKNEDFAKNIPSIWTDWSNRLDTNIMIIGQDWGPFNDMKALNNKYLEDKTIDNWEKIMDEEKSLTKKQLISFLRESSNGKLTDISHIYITNAIMCARKRGGYRGNNIDLKRSTLNCQNFLYKQIEIVKPKIILTLGYYPLYSLASIYNFEIEKNLTNTIAKYPEIKVNDLVIIPLYHPAAQIRKEEQLKQYERIWNYV